MSQAPVAHIAELWRFPVKSMQGERVKALRVLADGIEHDRRYAFVSSGAPAGKPRLTSRERSALLRFQAYRNAGRTHVRTPEGLTFPVEDPNLAAFLEEHLPQGNRIALEHEAGAAPYTDVRPIAILSTQTLATLSRSFGPVDLRRFRANLVLTFTAGAERELSGSNAAVFPEDRLSGELLCIGASCQLRILERIPRCRVVTLDPDTAEPDPTLMKHLDRHHNGRLGIYAAVITPGPVTIGDAVFRAASAADTRNGLPPLPAASRPTT